jgi:hypothetical protein
MADRGVFEERLRAAEKIISQVAYGLAGNWLWFNVAEQATA